MNVPLAPRTAAARRAGRACIAALALLALATHAPARAEGDGVPRRVAQPNSIRASLFVYPPSGFLLDEQPSDSYAGLTYARQLAAPVAWELTGGFGGPGGRKNGPHAGSLLRFTLLGAQRSTFTVGLGGHAAFLREYGTVGFGDLQAAWQLRTSSGFDLVLGGGVTAVVAGSRRLQPSPDCSWPMDCNVKRFEAGDVRPTFVLQTGWAF